MPISISQMFVSVGADVAGAVRGLSQIEDRMQSAARSIEGTGRALTAGITVPAVGVGAAIVKVGSEFEDSFAKVRKTVDLGVEDLRALELGIRNLATTEAGGGKSAAQLAQIASIAGQLGIEGGDALLAFTGVVARLSGATGLAEEQIATDLAGIAAVTRTPVEQWENMASAITDLGNKMAGSEAEIIELTTRLAGSLATVGVSTQDILGIASAMSALRINAEAGGTAVSKFFTEMVAATTGGGEVSEATAKKMREQQDRILDLSASLETATERQKAFGRNTPLSTVESTTAQIAKYQRELAQAHTDMAKLEAEQGGASSSLARFAKVAGVSSDAFRQLVKDDPSQAFVRIIAGISRLRELEGPAAALQALEDIGIDDSRMRDALLRLSSGQDLLAKAMGVSNDAWSENTALTEENRRAMETISKQWDLLINQLQEQAIRAWEGLRPHILRIITLFKSELVPRIQQVIDWFKTLSPEMQKNALLWAAFAVAAGPVLLVAGGLVTALGALASPLGIILVAVGALTAAWLANAGGIQEKVLPWIQRLSSAVELAKVKWEQSAPAMSAALGGILTTAQGIWERVAPTFTAIIGRFFDVTNNVMGRINSLWVTWGVFVLTVVERVAREFGTIWERFVLPAVQNVSRWIGDHIGRPLLELLKMLGNIAQATGITGAVGGINIGEMVRQGELALAGLSRDIAGGGPGTANEVVVNINNPVVPDQTVAERFAREIKAEIFGALSAAENLVGPAPTPGLPGRPF